MQVDRDGALMCACACVRVRVCMCAARVLAKGNLIMAYIR